LIKFQIIKTFSGILFSTIICMPQYIPTQSHLYDNSSTRPNKEVFKDTSDMNLFLDNLIDKKIN